MISDKKGAGQDFLMRNLMYIILAVAFFIILYLFVVARQDGAALWEDFYAKEVALLIDSTQPGADVWIDVTSATNIAFNRGVKPEELFTFDNRNNLVSISLHPGGATSYPFFNDVDIAEYRLELPSDREGAETNWLHFKVVKRAAHE